MGFDRIERISEEMKRECAEVLRELKDPRIPEFISVMKVDVTKDLKFAKVYVSIFAKEYNGKEVLKGLSSGAGFMRKEIGKRMQLRYTPEFSFVIDHGIEQGAHINEIIKDLNQKEE